VVPEAGADPEAEPVADAADEGEPSVAEAGTTDESA
jgi:hypothetical protein